MSATDMTKTNARLLEELEDLRGRLVRAEQRAAESEHREQRYRHLFESTLNAVVIMDARSHRILDANPAAVDLYGYGRDQLLKFRAEDVSAEPQATAGAIRQSVEVGPLRIPVRWHRKRDGTVFPVEIVGSSFEVDGRPLTCAVISDISERLQAQKALQESEDKFRTLFEFLPCSTVCATLEGNIIECNRQFVELHATKGGQEAQVGRNMSDFFASEEWDRLVSANRRMFEERQRQGPVEYVLLREDGTRFEAEVSTTLICDQDGNPAAVIAHAQDISERRRAEEEVRKAQRIESLGILAGGIAHDFNNILTGILGNVSMAQLEASLGEDISGSLEAAQVAAVRAKQLTSQLLTFSRGGAPVKKSASVKEIIEESAGFVLRGSNVKCHRSYDDELWSASIDAGQVSQVFNNLLINADQAMGEGGVIRVQAKNALLNEGNPFSLPAGEYVTVDIEDQGPGIPEAALSKIFDPYFTTKEQGSGLGLTTSYSIVKQHGGTIAVESNLGEGTTFHVYLPALREREEDPDRSDKIIYGTGRVLLLDDEEIVRKIATAMLQRIGYEVVAVTDGADAIKRFKQDLESGKPFDVVMLDLTIPGGMGGREVIRELRRIDPDVKAIVASGYSNDPVMANHETYGFRGVVAKPFRVDELSGVLHQVMSD